MPDDREKQTTPAHLSRIAPCEEVDCKDHNSNRSVIEIPKQIQKQKLKEARAKQKKMQEKAKKKALKKEKKESKQKRKQLVKEARKMSRIAFNKAQIRTALGRH